MDVGRHSIVVATVVLALAGPAAAQSALDRPPNLGGTWVGAPGTVYFNFLHRFDVGNAPARKVFNSPTFLLAAALPARTLLGVRYATNSLVVDGYPNEFEFFGRWAALSRTEDHPVDLAVSAAYNQAARSFDGEVTVAREVGRLRVLGNARGFSDLFRTGEPGFALGGGAVLTLSSHVAVGGDLAGLVGSPVPTRSVFEERNEQPAWSAGVLLRIPTTPHTLSIHASNTNTTTMQGGTFGIDAPEDEFLGVLYWGFEFTIPFTLSRYFGGEGGQRAPADPGVRVAAEVGMTNQLAFGPMVVRIRAGEGVRWRNTSDLVHTVTADPARAGTAENVRLPSGAETFHSGDLRPGDVFVHTFRTPGEYRYICVPHEAAGMVATVIVEE